MRGMSVIPVQQLAALFYAGSAIGAVFAGDLVTLFFYWEGTAIASVFLIWARRTEAAYHTGLRYLIIQITSGVILLAGTALLFRETGSIAFQAMTLGSLGTWLIFLVVRDEMRVSAFAQLAAGQLSCGHCDWNGDPIGLYHKAGGLCPGARLSPGTEILIYIGAVMTLFPIFFAEIENDLRRVLAYSLNNQLGFMVVGIGVGTELALNGTASHAFAHILYKALLFMSVGAVLFRTGHIKSLGAWGPVPDHAAHGDLLSDGRGVDFGLSAVFGICHQIADFGRHRGRALSRHLGGTGVCLGGCAVAIRASKFRISHFLLTTADCARKRHRPICSWRWGLPRFSALRLGSIPNLCMRFCPMRLSSIPTPPAMWLGNCSCYALRYWLSQY